MSYFPSYGRSFPGSAGALEIASRKIGLVWLDELVESLSSKGILIGSETRHVVRVAAKYNIKNVPTSDRA